VRSEGVALARPISSSRRFRRPSGAADGNPLRSMGVGGPAGWSQYAGASSAAARAHSGRRISAMRCHSGVDSCSGDSANPRLWQVLQCVGADKLILIVGYGPQHGGGTGIDSVDQREFSMHFGGVGAEFADRVLRRREAICYEIVSRRGSIRSSRRPAAVMDGWYEKAEGVTKHAALRL